MCRQRRSSPGRHGKSDKLAPGMIRLSTAATPGLHAGAGLCWKTTDGLDVPPATFFTRSAWQKRQTSARNDQAEHGSDAGTPRGRWTLLEDDRRPRCAASDVLHQVGMAKATNYR